MFNQLFMLDLVNIDTKLYLYIICQMLYNLFILHDRLYKVKEGPVKCQNLFLILLICSINYVQNNEL